MRGILCLTSREKVALLLREMKRNEKKKKGFFLSMVGIPIAGAATAISLMRPRWNLGETEKSVSS